MKKFGDVNCGAGYETPPTLMVAALIGAAGGDGTGIATAFAAPFSSETGHATLSVGDIGRANGGGWWCSGMPTGMNIGRIGGAAVGGNAPPQGACVPCGAACGDIP